ncbi:hypothetical protein EZS27_005564 [termite gut metagenome]|uniref:Type VII secretion system protein EssD-like domain-containing protein n=1 Tax=termite gut metagenome TaxID=433724 RepID=A0A5J4SNS5_9ZZZZ
MYKSATQSKQQSHAMYGNPKAAKQAPINKMLQTYTERILQLQRNEVNEPPSPNQTGLPDKLKSRIEAVSGLSMNGVQIHPNSSIPAQLRAFACTQGTDIYLAPGHGKGCAQMKTDIRYGYSTLTYLNNPDPHRVGKKTTAILNPTNPVRGTSTSANTGALSGLMTAIKRTELRKGFIVNNDRSNYVRGHLLNHDLGGQAIDENLYPITSKANHLHSMYVESPIKRRLAEGKKNNRSFQYEVNVIYECIVQDLPRATFECKFKELNDPSSKKERVLITSIPPNDGSCINTIESQPSYKPLEDWKHTESEAKHAANPNTIENVDLQAAFKTEISTFCNRSWHERMLFIESLFNIELSNEVLENIIANEQFIYAFLDFMQNNEKPDRKGISFIERLLEFMQTQVGNEKETNIIQEMIETWKSDLVDEGYRERRKIIEFEFKFKFNFAKVPDNFAKAQNNFAKALNYFDEAKIYFDEAKIYFDEVPNYFAEVPNNFAEALNNFDVALNYFDEVPNNFAEALNYLDVALNNLDEVPNNFDEVPNNFDEALNYLDVAQNYFAEALNYFAEALNYFDEAPNYFAEAPNNLDEALNYFAGALNYFAGALNNFDKVKCNLPIII